MIRQNKLKMADVAERRQVPERLRIRPTVTRIAYFKNGL